MIKEWLLNKITSLFKSSNTEEWKALTEERKAMTDERKSVTQEIKFLKDEYKGRVEELERKLLQANELDTPTNKGEVMALQEREKKYLKQLISLTRKNTVLKEYVIFITKGKWDKYLLEDNED